MPNHSYWKLNMREIAARVRAGDVTALAVVDDHLERIAKVNPELNALTVVFADRARELARAIDSRIANGEQVGPLAGVPFSIKENLDLVWSASTNGWTFRKEAIPDTNSTMVQRLLDADAIPIGRGNMPPMGLRWDTDNELFGRTFNPWDRKRVAGGSSGGDAVAVATGMAPLGLGNDYGGSLRLPAYAAGVCALRPSAGRVPLGGPADEPVPLSEQFFAVNGPIARSVDDLDVAFALIHGKDDIDPQAISVFHPRDYLGLRRVAVTRDPLGWGVEPEVADGISRAADALAAAGWEVVEATPPRLEEAANLWREISVTELVDVFKPGSLPAPIDADATTYFLENSSETRVLESIQEYGDAWGCRYLVAAEWEVFQAMYPVILGPVSGSRMPLIGYDLSGPQATTQLWRDHRLLVAVNLLGLPSVALPTGLGGSGMPTGVQVISARNCDHIAIAAARDIEAMNPAVTPMDPRG